MISLISLSWRLWTDGMSYDPEKIEIGYEGKANATNTATQPGGKKKAPYDKSEEGQVLISEET